MSKTTDLSYSEGGLFATFYANTEYGVIAWNELAQVTGGTGKVLTMQLKHTIKALKKAGYTVSKVKQDKTLDDVLKEYDSLVAAYR